MKRFLLTCALATVAAEPGIERAAGAQGATKDVVATAVEAGHFKTLVKALEAAGLVETLKGKGPFTIFAPSDQAFAKLPSGALDDLLKPENKEKLKAILLMHVVPDDLLIADVKKIKDLPTVGGTRVAVTHNLLTGVHIGTAKEMAHVQNSDIHATNGVIHVIDKVILP
ncbi:MAG: fasciclin domain-containing protein [Planctomycetaceae bacterium]|nr:fasciclin domain-containing protein [Planctomycetaceae bacterium]